MTSNLESIRDKVHSGERLSFDDGLFLYEPSTPLHEIGELANLVRERLNGNVGYYNINTHLNPTNVCVYRCIFCAFRSDLRDPRGYAMSDEQILDRGREAVESGCTEMHEFVVEVHVGMAQGLPRAQDMLDSFISTSGTNSISTALETDKTLGAVVDTCVVDAFEAYNFGLLNGVDTLMARVPVTVWLDVS